MLPLRFARFVALLVVVVAMARGVGHAAPASGVFTVRERAQGYREHVILAKSLAAHRASVDDRELREGVRVRQTFSRFGDLRVITLDRTDATDRAIARLRATGRHEFVERDRLHRLAERSGLRHAVAAPQHRSIRWHRSPASRESSSSRGAPSVWFRWQAPRSGRFLISVSTVNFDPLLGVYTAGPSGFAALGAGISTVAANDNIGAGAENVDSSVTLEALAGASYWISVDAKRAANAGEFTLSSSDALWQAATLRNITGALPSLKSASKIGVSGNTSASDLPPGNYTAAVSGANNATGVALVEIYEVP